MSDDDNNDEGVFPLPCTLLFLFHCFSSFCCKNMMDMIDGENMISNEATKIAYLQRHTLCYGDTTPRHYEQHYTHETTIYDDALHDLHLHTPTTIMTRFDNSNLFALPLPPSARPVFFVIFFCLIL